MVFFTLSSLRESLPSILLCICVIIYLLIKRRAASPTPQRRVASKSASTSSNAATVVSASTFLIVKQAASDPNSYDVIVDANEAMALMDLASSKKKLAVVCLVPNGAAADAVINHLNSMGFFSRGVISQKDVLFATTAVGKHAIVRQLLPAMFVDDDRDALLYMKPTGTRIFHVRTPVRT